MSTVALNLETDDVVLPAPALPARTTLEAALRLRRSSRDLLPHPLPVNALSALLWAAFGVNRAGGGRTAPSAHNWQEITVYAVLREGCYRYEAPGHRLCLVKAQDLRHLTGTQAFVTHAPLNLVYVADFARMTDAAPHEREFLAGVASGCIAENVYLACAALSLGTVLRGLVDRRVLAQALGLPATQRITLAQSVGEFCLE